VITPDVVLNVTEPAAGAALVRVAETMLAFVFKTAALAVPPTRTVSLACTAAVLPPDDEPIEAKVSSFAETALSPELSGGVVSPPPTPPPQAANAHTIAMSHIDRRNRLTALNSDFISFLELSWVIQIEVFS
jgi:hypothetical protein